MWRGAGRARDALGKTAVRVGRLGTFAGVIAGLVAFMLELEDRQSERIFRAWEVVIAASSASGTRAAQVDGTRLYEADTSARKALEFLNRNFDGWFCSSIVGMVSEVTTGNSRRNCVFPSKRRESFKGLRLARMNLRGAWLPGAELTFGYLDQVNLAKANLQNALLRHAVLTRAQLWEVDLRGARLQGADLSDADFRGADLRGADMRSNVELNDIPTYTNLLGAQRLTCSQLQLAKGWEQTLRDADLACGEAVPDHREPGTGTRVQ